MARTTVNDLPGGEPDVAGMNISPPAFYVPRFPDDPPEEPVRVPDPTQPPGTACGCPAQGNDHRCIPAGNVWVHPSEWVPPGFVNPKQEGA